MNIFAPQSSFPVQVLFGAALAICVTGMFLSQLTAKMDISVLSTVFLYISVAGSIAATVIAVLIMVSEAIELLFKSSPTAG